MCIRDRFKYAYLNKVPEHQQIAEFTTLKLDHALSDTLTLNVKYSYGTRDYFHMNDNDYGYTSDPLPGVLGNAGMGLPPISWEAEFYSFS